MGHISHDAILGTTDSDSSSSKYLFFESFGDRPLGNQRLLLVEHMSWVSDQGAYIQEQDASQHRGKQPKLKAHVRDTITTVHILQVDESLHSKKRENILILG